MRVLGVSAHLRDSAAVLLVDGEAVAGARESWFTRRRSDPGFPRRAAHDCLRRAGLRAHELDAVVLARKPLLEFERVLVSGLRAFPRSARSFSREMFSWLGDRLWMRNGAASELELPFERVRFVQHHRALAAAAWSRSPFEAPAVLTFDEGGEWTTTLMARVSAAGVETIGELQYPDSLALFALGVARMAGLGPGDEARLEGLAALGEPCFESELGQLAPQAADGSLRLARGLLRADSDGELALSPDHVAAFAGGLFVDGRGHDRRAELAASLQAVLERRVLGVARELERRTGARQLCLSGSLTANRRLVARVADEGPFEGVFVPGAPDEGEAALGAALLGAAELGAGEAGDAPLARSPAHALLGASASPATDEPPDGARRLADSAAVRDELCGRLSSGAALAWVRAPHELGAASLGRRAVLRSASGADAGRELLAAAGRNDAGYEAELLIPAELVGDWLAFPEAARPALARGRVATLPRAQLEAHAPSAICADGRVLALPIDRASDPELHALLLAFGARNGAPLLLHTSFTLPGAAPICQEVDAHEAFSRSRLDALVFEEHLYEAR